MNVVERALVFDCDGQPLLGVASLPAEPRELGVLVIVGGPQYRAGSHRQFVQTARRLAGEGFAALRFDVRGMGDSFGELRSFELLDNDIKAGIDALLHLAPQIQRVALWGLCDGASAALLYLDSARPDPRVAGLCLVNPWVRSETTMARAEVRHYYLRRIMHRDFWLKLIRGNVTWKSIRELATKVGTSMRRATHSGNAESRSFQERMRSALTGFRGRTLLALSGKDMTAREFADMLAAHPGWNGLDRQPNVERLDLPEADHTLSVAGTRRVMEDRLLQWLHSMSKPAMAHSPSTLPTLAGDWRVTN